MVIRPCFTAGPSNSNIARQLSIGTEVGSVCSKRSKDFSLMTFTEDFMGKGTLELKLKD